MLQKIFYGTCISAFLFAPPPGLINCGNSCYMNSMFQLIFNLPEFRKMVDQAQENHNDPAINNIIRELKNLSNSWTGQQRIINPENTVGALIKKMPRTEPGQQGDAGEPLPTILTAIDPGGRLCTIAEIQEIYDCSINTTFKSTKKENATLITLLVRDTLEACLLQYIEKTPVKYAPPNGDSQDCFKRTIIQPEATYCIFMFQLFDGLGSKIPSKNIRIPLVLNMAPYGTQPEISQPFTLVGVSVHSGRASDGHYYAYIKDPVDHLWYLCNDSSITQQDPQPVDLWNGDASGDPLLLIYKRGEKQQPPLSPAYQTELRKFARSLEKINSQNQAIRNKI